MKLISALFLLMAAVSFPSCNTQSEPEKPIDKQEVKKTNPVIGKWQLTKTEDEANHSRLENGLSKIVLNIQQNGFFIVYDTFVDPSWKKKGLPLIEERSSGQWEMVGKKLVLRYSDEDGNRVEELEVTKLNDSEMVTKNKQSKAAVYKVYGKK